MINPVYSIRFHSSSIESSLAELPSGLFELRLKAGEGIARVFYCCLSGQQIVILHHFIKKSQKTPPQHLETARKRQQELIHGK